MKILIKLFKTPLGYYVYDRDTNVILNIQPNEYKALQNILAGNGNENDQEILKKFQDKGYCKNSPLEEIRHPESLNVNYHLNHRLQKITLQLTQNCNLRCHYCAYSGKYNQRSHAQISMSEEMIQKSIDFAMGRSDCVEELNIGFYGGEPLLEFKNMKNAVKYVKSKYSGRKVSYSITTNGTIISDEIIKFFIDNKFRVLVSLDGPKEMHNRSRVFANGQGSFDKIMENLLFVKENYPSFFDNISFNTVIPPENDFKCINDFFKASDLIEGNNLSKATVSTYNIKESVNYDDKYFITYKYENLKVIMAELGLYSKNKVSNLFSADFIEIKRCYKALGKTAISTSVAHPGGPCIPGAKRPMVDIYGNIYPCEKVSETSEVMRIGTVDEGFNINKIKGLLNLGNLTREQCKDCWNFVYCGLCASAADNSENLSKNKKLSRCDNSKRYSLNTLISICLLSEHNYDFEEEMY